MGYIIAAVVIAVIVIPLIITAVITMKIAKREYENTFVRTSPEKWARENSCPSNEEHTVMYNTGLAWGEKNADFKKEVGIVSDGLKLVGELFDFGFDKCAIILSGRAEALKYSYYFAEPYQKLGYNVLVIDGRAHGNSEGKLSCVGVRETGDVVKWAELMHNEYRAESIVIHGLCIGSSTAIFIDAKHIPYIKLLVLEGPYTTFMSVLKQRTKNGGHPTFPVPQELAFLIKKNTGVNIRRETPISYIGQVQIPVLFLCGRMDVSSIPENCEKLFEACGSKVKKIVWFERGAHSHLRIANTEKYDAEVTAFVTENE